MFNKDKVTFTPEFEERTKYKPLTSREKAKLRWEKLKEAVDEGLLSACKNRADVAALIGLEGSAGSSWVYGLVNNGGLIEVPAGRNSLGIPIKTYYLGATPAVVSGKRKSSKKKRSVKKPVTEGQPGAATPRRTKTQGLEVELRVGGRSMIIRGMAELELTKIVRAFLK